jgi:hypothetical protein
VRLLTADIHPDHDTLGTFRRENQALPTESFVQVLELAQSLKLLKFGQLTVAADGPKVLAHASKHSAVSYERAGKMITQLELEVHPLLAKAEPTDATPLQDGLTIPGEKTSHHRRVADLEVKSEPAPPPAGASVPEVLSYRLKTAAGQALYKLRQEPVEPVLGIIKSVLGFQQFRLRGQVKAAL